VSTGVPLAGVVRSYRVDDQQTITALDGVDLEVTGGSVVALWGQSGSGKSTLLQFVGGLDRPDAGEIRWTASPSVGSRASTSPPSCSRARCRSRSCSSRSGRRSARAVLAAVAALAPAA
jgi:ABC-type dipeptide/oligopeptide/nickel transport system ATPase subunit